MPTTLDDDCFPRYLDDAPVLQSARKNFSRHLVPAAEFTIIKNGVRETAPNPMTKSIWCMHLNSSKVMPSHRSFSLPSSKTKNPNLLNGRLSHRLNKNTFDGIGWHFLKMSKTDIAHRKAREGDSRTGV